MKNEKRRFIRIYIPTPIKIATADGIWIGATALNISKDGLRIRLKDDKGINHQTKTNIRIGNISSPIGIKIRWNKKSDIGAKFLDTLDENTFSSITKRPF